MKKMFNIRMALPSSRRNVTYILGIFAILYLLILYALGLYFGFYTATIKFSFKAIINFILPILMLIVITEFVREKILSGNFKYKKVLAFTLLFLTDIIVNVGKYDLTESKDFLTLIGYVICVSIANNLLFNYISLRYGKMPNIIYRFITSLYIYIIPILPDIHVLIHTLIKLMFPYIIYRVLEYTYVGNHIVKEKKSTKIISIILALVMIAITMLVSCKFKYGILVIGSESMSGAISKGDAIIFEQYKNQKIKNNQILIFKSDKRTTVHRVIEIKNVNDEKRYYTKGDANKENDSGYITDEDIIGIYKFKIEKIGYLTLLFNNIFEK